VELWAWRHYYDTPAPTGSPTPSLIPVPTTITTSATPAAGATPTATPAPARGEHKRDKDPVLLGTGVKRFVTEGSLTYPAWDFNNVDVSYAKTANKDHWLEMFVIVNGDIKMEPAPWIYGGDDNKNWQDPRPMPAESCK
jgi:hypothetical protein